MSAWCIQILGGQVSITKRYYLMSPGGHESCMPDIAESTTDNSKVQRVRSLRSLNQEMLSNRIPVISIFTFPFPYRTLSAPRL